ncbi:Transposase IS66 family protein [Chitinophaga filiformis]|uniref:Transposase IS66 family protein n=1 Tax=Chitinophaga filiformis TaxID=104663 RepID=A0A1G7SKX6_CHIFI|nr:Transposase IS66 family protein [Chitinophaga filiformis]
MLNPDNNPVERNIRLIALGRKNFLFAGSEKEIIAW